MIDDQDSAQPDTERELRNAVLNGNPKFVLEVGCGSGRIYSRLVNDGFTGVYTGVEMAVDVINTNKNVYPNAYWIVGTGYKLPVKSQSQDCVFSYYVLEHCAFPKLLFDELLSVVRRVEKSS